MVILLHTHNGSNLPVANAEGLKTTKQVIKNAVEWDMEDDVMSFALVHLLDDSRGQILCVGHDWCNMNEEKDTKMRATVNTCQRQQKLH